MPPAKRTAAHDDTRLDAATLRERQAASAAYARSKKLGASAQPNGGPVKELALVNSTVADGVAGTGIAQAVGISWNTAPSKLLESYRVSHNLATPAAFTSPYRQALLTNPGIGRQSPTMARKKEKRRIAKDELALAVRKNFNAAAVSEIDVVVDLLYKVRNQERAFRMRPSPGVTKR